MSLTYTDFDYSTTGASSLASGSISYTAGQPIVVLAGGTSASFNPTISDTAGLTWTLMSTQTGASVQGRVWYAKPVSSGSTVITVTNAATSVFGFRVKTFTGAGTPVLVGGAAPGSVGIGTLLSQTVSPTSSGSALCMWIAQLNGPANLPATPGTGCTQNSNSYNAGFNQNWEVLPTTNPLTSNDSFTLATTTTTGTQDIAWIAIEIPSTGGGGPPANAVYWLTA